MSVQLELLRHGETEAGGGFRGRLDDALTATGWQQLRAAVVAAGPWDRIISSPLRRCADFAAELAEQRSLEFELEPDLRELDFGDWEGRTAADLMVDQSEALGRFWSDPYGFTPPGAEPVADFEARVLAAIERLTDRCAGERVLLVTHAGVMRLLLAQARGLPREGLLQVVVSHGALFGLRTGFADTTLWLEERCSPF
ncbi:alpha-ribazole phosphatase family protein [Stutzerimonas stutzeri]|uniref:Alpha-ribazole phosphatase n=1 Tax=Stutzerimonas stutzeri TaxID=316 RepID=A0A172WVZ3_STUST|nr:alpha-ribazole phosphatase family protein [Stutzerimonas stutzeri]ANF27701.1 alpha-ribazole phosphatase [Stutzerimonas stutzeri]MCQ4284991.1 alpha-ribazole phosphatase family protein [Stutzerimonas stutzeri]BAP79053.1 alpha-ribazole-5''''-phosphate phosphatase [Pseudomonas sp. MT-1]HAB64743.1 histidine phosphatase family protein [Pseudomonas sp.]